MWAPLLRFAVELEVRTQRDAAKLLRASDDEMLDALLDAVREDGLHDELGALVSRLPATEMKKFAARLAPAAGEELLETLTAAAQDAELDALHDALAAA